MQGWHSSNSFSIRADFHAADVFFKVSEKKLKCFTHISMQNSQFNLSQDHIWLFDLRDMANFNQGHMISVHIDVILHCAVSDHSEYCAIIFIFKQWSSISIQLQMQLTRTKRQQLIFPCLSWTTGTRENEFRLWSLLLTLSGYKKEVADEWTKCWTLDQKINYCLQQPMTGSLSTVRNVAETFATKLKYGCWGKDGKDSFKGMG